MARENPYYREILSDLIDKFGKDNLNVKEYAEYLGMAAETTARLIRKGDLPGKVMGNKEKPIYVIPVKSIALYEIHAAKV